MKNPVRIIPVSLILPALLICWFCQCGHTQQGAPEAMGPSRIDSLRAKGMTALNKSDFPTAISCGHLLLETASSPDAPLRDNDRDKARIYGEILLGQGFLFHDNDSLPASYHHLHNAELLCLKTKNDSALASVYNGLGLHATNVENDFHAALTYFFRGIDAAKRSDYQRLHHLLLSNVASIYALNNDPYGERYALECYRQGKATGDNFLRYTGSITAAYSYAMRGLSSPKAFDYIREAEMILHTDSLKDASTLYYVYGLLLNNMQEEREAMECFRRSIDSCLVSENGEIRGFIEYSRILLKNHRSEHAVSLLDTALTLTEKRKAHIFRTDVFNALSSTHRTLGHTALARKYAGIAEAERLAADSLRKQTIIESVKSKYDLERADNEVNRQRLELLEKQQTLNMLGAILIAVLAVTGSFIWLYRRKSRLYAAIVKQTTEYAREENRLRATIRRLEQTAAQPSAAPPSAEVRPEEKGPAPPGGTMDARLSELSASFESLMLDPTVYTDNLITKDKIARLLNTNRTYVSKIVNDVYKMSFTQFINSLRIKEAVRRLGDPDCDIPLKALAGELGYNSMTTFYTKFSEATGMTPAAFRNKARSMAGTERHDSENTES